MKIQTIYCDLDQVLVNFLGGARRILGKEFNDSSFQSEEEKWKLLSGINFWCSLDWMPNAPILWDRIRNHNTFLLTACPLPIYDPLAPAQKREWCVRNLGVDSSRVYTVERADKQKFAAPDHLLIDDHPRNVTEWRAAGGIAIQHITIPQTLLTLNQLGL